MPVIAEEEGHVEQLPFRHPGAENRDVHGRPADGSQPHAFGHLLLATQLRVREDLDVDGALGLRVNAVRHELHANRAREVDIAERSELAGDLLGKGR